MKKDKQADKIECKCGQLESVHIYDRQSGQCSSIKLDVSIPDVWATDEEVSL